MIEWIQTHLPNVYQMGWEGAYGWQTAIVQTLYMTFWSFLIGGLMGLLGGLFLVLTSPNTWFTSSFGTSFFGSFPIFCSSSSSCFS